MLAVARKDAKIVPIKTLSWVTEELKKTGATRFAIFLTPGWLGLNCGLSIIPCFLSPGTWIRNWNNPPRTTPTATPRMGCARNCRLRTTAEMVIMFNMTGESAGERHDRREL